MDPTRLVALVTDSDFPKLWSRADAGDPLLIPALKKLNIIAIPEVWTDDSVQWDKYDMLILRSTWDYHNKLEDFKKWLARVQSKLFNPLKIVMWNMDKKYLMDLSNHSCPIPESIFVEMKSSSKVPNISQIMKNNGWDRCIVKPQVGANSKDVFFLKSIQESEEMQTKLEKVFLNQDFIVQEYIPEILSDGEWSLCYFGGKFGHAVLSTPVVGQKFLKRDDKYKCKSLEPPKAVLDAGEKVVSYFREEILYCRVDLVLRGNGEVVIMELEVIEPSMFLGYCSDGADNFAKAIAERLEYCFLC